MSDRDGRNSGAVDLLASGLEDEGTSVSPWIWRIAGLLTLAVVAAVAGPDLLSSLSPRQPHSVASPTRSAQRASPLRANGIFVPVHRWAPRGSEVGSEFAAAALARIRVERPGVDRLLWAGSLDGHDLVVLVSYPRQPSQPGTDVIPVAALRVRRARDVPTARSEIIGYVSEAGAVVGLAWQGDDQHTRLLLLGRPGQMQVQVQVSSVADYHPSGRISRRWRDTELNDGVAVTDLGQHVDPFIVVRPKIPGVSTGTLVRVEGRPETASADEVTVSGASSSSYAGPDASLLVNSLSQAVGMLFDLGDADSTVLWSGRIASGRTEAGRRIIGRGALVLVRRHDGPMFRAFIYADRADESSSYEANTVRWSVADRLPFVFSTNEARAPELLVNPGGPGSVTLGLAVGAKRHVRLDSTGVGTLAPDAAAGPTIGGAQVVVRDPSGRIVLDSTMADPGTVDAFGL